MGEMVIVFKRIGMNEEMLGRNFELMERRMDWEKRGIKDKM